MEATNNTKTDHFSHIVIAIFVSALFTLLASDALAKSNDMIVGTGTPCGAMMLNALNIAVQAKLQADNDLENKTISKEWHTEITNGERAALSFALKNRDKNNVVPARMLWIAMSVVAKGWLSSVPLTLSPDATSTIYVLQTVNQVGRALEICPKEIEDKKDSDAAESNINKQKGASL